jgi:hypothetical protein
MANSFTKLRNKMSPAALETSDREYARVNVEIRLGQRGRATQYQERKSCLESPVQNPGCEGSLK